MPVEAGQRAYVERIPYGVVFGIARGCFNFPDHSGVLSTLISGFQNPLLPLHLPLVLPPTVVCESWRFPAAPCFYCFDDRSFTTVLYLSGCCIRGALIAPAPSLQNLDRPFPPPRPPRCFVTAFPRLPFCSALRILHKHSLECPSDSGCPSLLQRHHGRQHGSLQDLGIQSQDPHFWCPAFHRRWTASWCSQHGSRGAKGRTCRL